MPLDMAHLAIIADLIIKSLFFSIGVFFLGILGLKLYVEPFKAKCKCKTRLDGKVALVTDGNAGIGFETVKGLASRGASVVIACRNEEKSRAAIADIVSTTGNSNIDYRHLDLSKSRSIKKFAEDFNKTFDRLDTLVNNAGALGLKDHLTEDGIDIVTQINYVGPFYLTNLLLDKLASSRPSRIVIVSSFAHNLHNFDISDVPGKRNVGMWKKYCNSKLCNVMWAKALAKHLPQGVTANALHPGIVKTDIFDRINVFVRQVILFVIGSFFKTVEEGAQTSIHLCVAPELETVTGKYFSDCKVTSTAKLTKDDKMVEQLWKETMSLVENKFLNKL